MTIQPEEDITGFIVRQSFERNQGKILMRPNTVAISTKRPGWVFPSGLRPLVEAFEDDLPQLTNVIDRHTRFPLFSRFLSPAESDVLREHHAGHAMGGIAGFVGMSHSSRGRMAMCPDCNAIDVSENGYAFWRRLFLTPGIFACPTHERVLLTFCNACEAGHRRNRSNWWPAERCACGDSLQLVAEFDTHGLEAAIGIAKMAAEILNGTAPLQLSNATVCQAIKHSIGSVDGLNSRRYDLLAEALQQKIGKSMISRLGIGAVTVKRLGGFVSGTGYVRNPIQNLAAVHAVLGGFKEFLEALKASQSNLESLRRERNPEIVVPAKSSRKRKAPPIERYIAWVGALTPEEQWKLKFRYREWLLRLMIDNPGIQRSDLGRFSGRKAALRHLRHIDTHWYDIQLPPRSRISRAEDELLHIQEIRQLTEHIRHQYERASKKNPMVRVTKTFLLSNARCESVGSRAIRSEAVQQVLSKFIRAGDERRQNFRKSRREEMDRVALSIDERT